MSMSIDVLHLSTKILGDWIKKTKYVLCVLAVNQNIFFDTSPDFIRPTVTIKYDSVLIK